MSPETNPLQNTHQPGLGEQFHGWQQKLGCNHTTILYYNNETEEIMAINKTTTANNFIINEYSISNVTKLLRFM